MANILDYLTEHGQSSFNDISLNHIDMLILNEIAYLPLGEGKDLTSESTLVTWGEELLAHDLDFLVTAERLELLKAVLASARFSDLQLKAYVNEIDPTFDKQFAAALFYLPALDYYQLVFRGTDDSLVGWKEDFNMTYMSEIPAQRRAVAFLTDVLGQLPGTLVVTGHSKGGNLAVYASSFIAAADQDRIKAVYAFDAPGVHERVLASPGYERIKSKIVAIRPQDSIVGVMLESDRDPVIIASDKRGLEQHNVIHWQTDGYGLLLVEEGTKTSQILEQTFKSWTQELGGQELKVLVNLVFDVFAEVGIDSLNDLQENFPQKLTGVLSAFSNLPSQQREMMNQSVNVFFKHLLQFRFQQLTGDLDQKLAGFNAKLKSLGETDPSSKT
ncbi:Mbeg1-like protein [Streptococcus cuniculipharyngis]|uniref:DUF2974 domain-containing protein n=1 Tax=Streptococcus cuniculipharyngis TaxID=1562651 RepID=A0A5C5S8Z8_9STRE|nr:Mbeg1-like protein [Streptococcus cuniculipharyngis]TWS96886.1 DUF2974 domain-containing protein [Streptococcus cuniculipharyngis]